MNVAVFSSSSINQLVVKIQTHKRFKITLFIRSQTQYANLRGNPLYQATKRHLIKRLNGEKRWKMRWELIHSFNQPLTHTISNQDASNHPTSQPATWRSDDHNYYWPRVWHYHGGPNAGRCPARDDVDVVEPVHQGRSTSLGTRRQVSVANLR